MLRRTAVVLRSVLVPMLGSSLVSAGPEEKVDCILEDQVIHTFVYRKLSARMLEKRPPAQQQYKRYIF